MGVNKNKDGNWEWEPTRKHINPVYKEALVKYLNNLDPLFNKAKEKCEFEFVLSLLRIKGIEDPGWDTYENTQEVFRCMSYLKTKIKDFNTIRHVYLWLYGHIVEASVPYEILANLINAISGKRFIIDNFPDKARGKHTIPLLPAEKIDKLKEMAAQANINWFVLPLEDFFDRELRNAIFHSDYTLYEGEVRIRKPIKVYSTDEISSLINKALAYHEAFSSLYLIHIGLYQEPKRIPVHPAFSRDPGEEALTIIRKGYGLIGIKDNWTNPSLTRIGPF